MRLEDWQKWLEQQFLDTNPPPQTGKDTDRTAGAESAVALAEPPADGVHVGEPGEIGAPRPGSAERAAETDEAAAGWLPETRPAEPPLRAPVPTPVSQPPPIVSPVPIPQLAPRPTTSPKTGTGLPQPADLPSIENYLPTFRRKPPEAPQPRPDSSSTTSAEPQTPAAPSPSAQAVAPLVAPLSTGASPSRSQELSDAPSSTCGELPSVQPEVVNAPPSDVQPVVAEPAPLDAQVAETAPIPAATEPATEAEAQPEETTKATRPARKRRARSARHVTPPELAPPLTSQEFWELVPRHIRTLISMGQDEGVQRSYKRRFKESRLAMIERLLDPTLSLEETARILNVCPTTVRRYTNRGQLRHYRTPGDQRRFKLSDVLAFMEAQQAGRGRRSAKS